MDPDDDDLVECPECPNAGHFRAVLHGDYCEYTCPECGATFTSDDLEEL